MTFNSFSSIKNSGGVIALQVFPPSVESTNAFSSVQAVIAIIESPFITNWITGRPENANFSQSMLFNDFAGFRYIPDHVAM